MDEMYQTKTMVVGDGERSGWIYGEAYVGMTAVMHSHNENGVETAEIHTIHEVL